MSPQDVPGPIVTIESLFPWLTAIAPAVEPLRPKPQEQRPLPKAA
jgi:hypothetical protein